MKHITQTGATVEEAVESALTELQATRDQVTIEVIQEEKKGFLGFGAKAAQVKVTLKETSEKAEPELAQQETIIEETPEADVPAFTEELAPAEPKAPEQPQVIEEKEGEAKAASLQTAIEETKAYIQTIASEMGVTDLTITHEVVGKQANFHLESEKVALLIGKRGNTLNSLQQLAQLVANKYAHQFLIVQLDAENYRERRQETLKQLADRMADKAIRTGGRVQFEPMPSYERKVIHQFLSQRMDIDTYSEGTDPNRYLVIEPLHD